MSAEPIFRFLPQWKEELVVAGPGGRFILMFWMGIPTISLPPEADWQEAAPDWARSLWQPLHDELVDWCRFNNVALDVASGAGVYPA